MPYLFDFNGTCFFDDAFQEEAWCSYLTELTGTPVGHDDFITYILGKDPTQALSHFLGREVSPLEAIALEEEKEVAYRAACLASPEFKLAPGLPDYLDRLKAAGEPMAIATGSAKANVDFFFEHLGLDRWFDRAQVALNDGTFPGKPAPDVYLVAAERLGVPLETCTIFEDSPAGVAAGRAAGAKQVIGVTSVVDADTLLAAGADATIATYQEL